LVIMKIRPAPKNKSPCGLYFLDIFPQNAVKCQGKPA
jgi:hypothetical protein